MRPGCTLPVNAPGGGPAGPRDLAEGAALMERVGFRSLWVFDGVGRGFILPDPLMALSVAATVTTTVELGTGILQLPLRGTADTAYRALTLHHLAEGRFLLGVGPGSTRADYDAFGVPYDERFIRFVSELPQLRDALRTGRVPGGDLTPWPSALGGPPVLYAGWRSGWIERAAAEADGWIASAAYCTDDVLADGIARFRDRGGARAIVTNVRVERDLAPAVDRLHRFAQLGFDDAVVLVIRPTEERLRALVDGAAR